MWSLVVVCEFLQIEMALCMVFTILLVVSFVQWFHRSVLHLGDTDAEEETYPKGRYRGFSED